MSQTKEPVNVRHFVMPNLLLVCRGNRKTLGRVLSLDGVTLATLWSAEVGLFPDAIAVFKKSSQ